MKSLSSPTSPESRPLFRQLNFRRCSHCVRLSSRSHLQDVEPGDGSGDHHPQRPPKQRGVSQVLSFLLPAFLRFHLLYQGLGHPRHGQMRPHVYVSLPRCSKSDSSQQSPFLFQCFASFLSSQLFWAGGFRRRLCGHHDPHDNLCAGRVSDQPDSPEPNRFCALRFCWKHGSHVGPQQVHSSHPFNAVHSNLPVA